MGLKPTGGAGEAPERIDAPEAPRADEVLDVVGLLCPVPIVRTAARVRRMDAGRVLEVRADDPVTRVDLPNWCRGAGHRFLGWCPADGGELRLFLEVVRPRRGPSGSAGGTDGA